MWYHIPLPRKLGGSYPPAVEIRAPRNAVIIVREYCGGATFECCNGQITRIDPPAETGKE